MAQCVGVGLAAGAAIGELDAAAARGCSAGSEAAAGRRGGLGGRTCSSTNLIGPALGSEWHQHRRG